MGKTKYLSAFERGMVVGARRTGLNVSRTGKPLGFSCSTVSCVYQEWSTTQRTSSLLDTTVGSIGVNMGQNAFGTLQSMPQQIEAVLRAKGGGQLNIRKAFLMFCAHSIYRMSSTANNKCLNLAKRSLGTLFFNCNRFSNCRVRLIIGQTPPEPVSPCTW